MSKITSEQRLRVRSAISAGLITEEEALCLLQESARHKVLATLWDEEKKRPTKVGAGVGTGLVAGAAWAIWELFK